MRIIGIKYPRSVCKGCQTPLEIGQDAYWFGKGQTFCEPCGMLVWTHMIPILKEISEKFKGFKLRPTPVGGGWLRVFIEDAEGITIGRLMFRERGSAGPNAYEAPVSPVQALLDESPYVYVHYKAYGENHDVPLHDFFWQFDHFLRHGKLIEDMAAVRAEAEKQRQEKIAELYRKREELGSKKRKRIKGPRADGLIRKILGLEQPIGHVSYF